jgi:gamma-glutamyltranspeptidase/glutathione hydrolase
MSRGPHLRQGRRTGRRPRLELAVLLVWVVGTLLATTPKLRAQRARGRTAAATEHPLATRAALAQMRAGGNAIDAAVAAALVGGVVNPTSSGIGGGGFVLVWLGADRRPYLLDFRETAPLGLDAAPFERRPFSHSERGRLVGVPGEVRGLFELHRKLGRRKWTDVVAPALRHAKVGFAVGRHLASMLRSQSRVLRREPGLAAVFYPGGRPAALGRRLTNPKLAATLERVANQGPSALYEGAVAADIVDSVRAAGGQITPDDLRNYRAVERRPLHVRWEGYDVYTMPPPSAGGMMLAQTLRLFSRERLRRVGFNTGAYQHLVAEGMRAAVADRMRYLGDPDHVAVDIKRLLAPARMTRRRQSIALDRTHAIPRFGLEESGTHHLVTADAGGNWVSLTTTVNRFFGAKVTGTQSGIVLNDELDDFTRQQDVAPFGMTQSPNRPRPGARPVSSMTPTIVAKNGQAVFALGGSGGTAIATNVTQLLLARLTFAHSPAALVKQRRFYVPTEGAYIWLERGAASAHVADLERRGEIVGTVPYTKSAVQLIAVEKGFKVPAADPRKHGSAAAR